MGNQRKFLSFARLNRLAKKKKEKLWFIYYPYGNESKDFSNEKSFSGDLKANRIVLLR